jgi:hypothetical protein
MKCFYTKHKFTTGLFYKKIDHTIVEHIGNIFRIQIMPFFAYSGKCCIEYLSKKDNERTIYLTKK